MVHASALTGLLEVLGVWGFAITYQAGFAAYDAMRRGCSDEEIASAAARGAAHGFAGGLVLAVVAALVLGVTS